MHRALHPVPIDTCPLPDVPPPGAVAEALDVTYATMDGQPQRLDLAWPKTSGNHALIVIIHGGGWSAGTKDLYRKEVRRLASIGYAAATIDYRLANVARNIWPAPMQDVRCAVRWLRAHAGEYAVDQRRVVAVGASAGGQLAAMLGVAADGPGFDSDECPVNDQPVAVSAVVSYYGAYDLRTPSTTFGGMMVPAIAQLFGGDETTVTARSALASPITHVDASDPPFLLLHAPDDPIIPIASARAFDTELRQAGVSSLLVEVDDAKPAHGFPLLVTTRPRVTCTTLAFLRAAVGD